MSQPLQRVLRTESATNWRTESSHGPKPYILGGPLWQQGPMAVSSKTLSSVLLEGRLLLQKPYEGRLFVKPYPAFVLWGRPSA